MGGDKGLAQPSGFIPNGLFPNQAATVTRVLDPERWSQAEARIAELLACIQPSQPSEERRNAVASYVRHLIMKCFSCQVFTFGSVPLKTYLPDGDIDLTAFSKNQKLKDTWANEVRDMLESEEKSEDSEFRVKEVQYIQAEVKIIKCLVENIVVDISFNQLGGLCTLCFLEQVDQLINQNHLFKRSIILIKAWCYYESRILGAHYGLISTYALETLVLYIFHVFNCSFAGPLEVLYRFLEFFSKFDWDNFCVSLWGPVPINSLPNMTVDPPRKDDRELFLSKLFFDVCSSEYAVLPGSKENQEQPFVSKHFNIVDPLRTNNNLGRSVSKGNFFRIRSAFAFGAQRLARLLDCPKENLIDEANQFFTNTWNRHGKGHRLDAPSPDLYGLRSVNLNQIDGSDRLRDYSSSNNAKEDSVGHESEVEVTPASHADGVSSQHGNQSLRRMSRNGNISPVSLTQVQKIYANLTNSMASDQNPEILQNINFNENTYIGKGRSTGSDYMRNEVHDGYQFARTHSSPQLTGTSSVLSRGRRNRASETGNGQTAPARSDNSRRNLGPEVLDNNSARFSTGDSPSSRQSSSDRSIDAAVDSSNASNSYYGDSGVGAIVKNHQSVDEAMQMHQEEQDFVNMMASRGYNLNGQVHMPFNLSSAYPPFPIPPTSLGYAQKNLAGMVPTSVPSFESSWGSNMHNVQGLVPLPVSQYFPTVEMASNREELTNLVDGNLVSMELKQEDGDHGFWPVRDADPVRGYDRSNKSLHARPLEDRQQFTSVGSNSVHSSRVSSSDSSSLKEIGLSMENRGLNGENYSDNFQYQRIGDSDVHSTSSSRSVSASQTTSSRTKLPSENFSDGSPLKNSKSTRDKQGRKSAPSTDPSVVYGLGENGWQYEGESVDHVSSLADDIREWIPLSTVGTDAAESTVSGSVTSSRVQTHQKPGYEPALVSGSNSILPVAPVLGDPESQQRASDNHGMLPFAFYPTGPPVPFFTMIPVYNLPTETGIPSVSRNHFDRDEEFNKCQKSQLDHSLDSTANVGHSEIFDTSDSLKDAASVEPSEQRKSDILNGDFSSHLQNLQYGRACQNARPLLYPPAVVEPSMYLQGHFPWDGPGRPPAANVNNLTQFMGYSPRLIPVSPMQPGSSRTSGVYQQYADEIPRYRGGTGTYLPNPKLAFRDRQSSNTRSHRGNYSYDRKDHHGDREVNWSNNSKSRFVGRGQGRNQFEKSSMRANRGAASNSRSDKPWNSLKHDSLPPYYSHNGSFSFSNSMNHGSTNSAYGMYPLPVENHSEVSPSVVMLYPYDQNMGYGSPAEQLEFRSLGPVHFSGIDDASHLCEGSSGAIIEQRDFRGDSGHSSPDQPPSPQLQRGV